MDRQIEEYSPFHPKNNLFRRCVICPAAFTGTCPLCAENEICSLSESTCEKCVSTYCLKIANQVTVTVSVAVGNPTASVSNTSTALSSVSSTNTASSSISGTNTASSAVATQIKGSSSSNGSGASAGAVAGGVVGGLIVLAVLVAVSFFLLRRQKQEKGFVEEKEQRHSYMPEGGRYELDPDQIVRPLETDGEAQIHEIDGREKPAEAG